MALKYIYNPETGLWIPQWDYSDGSERYLWVPNYGETSPAYNVDRGYVVKPIPEKTDILIDSATNSPVPYKQTVKIVNPETVEALRSLPEVEVVANRYRNIPSDYDALLGEGRVSKNRIAWQRNPNLMLEYKAANDAVGLAALSLAAPGMRTLHPLIRWGIPALTTAYAGYNIYDNYARGTEPLYLDEEASAEPTSVTPEVPTDSVSGASSASAQPEPPKNDNENKNEENKELGNLPEGKKTWWLRTRQKAADKIAGNLTPKTPGSTKRFFKRLGYTSGGITGGTLLLDIISNRKDSVPGFLIPFTIWASPPGLLYQGVDYITDKSAEYVNRKNNLQASQQSLNNQSPSQSTNLNANQGSNQNTNGQTNTQSVDTTNVLNKIRSMINGNQNQQ